MSGLFWWSATRGFDPAPQYTPAEVRDRHPDGFHRALASILCVDAGQIIDTADHDSAIGSHGSGPAAHSDNDCNEQGFQQLRSHCWPLELFLPQAFQDA
jgi:hypothetical protein